MPGGLGYTYPNPIRAREADLALLARRRRRTRRSRTRRRLPHVGTGARARRLRPQAAAVREVRRRRPRRGSTASSPTATRRASRTACTTCASRTASCSRRAAPARLAALVPLTRHRLDPIYRYSDQRRPSLGPRDRAHRRGPPAHRLHAARREPDTFYFAYHTGTRWVSRRIVEAGPGRPSFHSGGASLDHADPRIVYLSRTIGPLEPGRGVVHPRPRAHLDASPADHRPARLRHPPGRAARAPRPPARAVRARRRPHARLHRLVARARPGLLTGAAACAVRRPPEVRAISRRAGSAGPRRCRGRRRCWTRTRRRLRA